MNAYIYHPGTGTYLNPFETYFVEAPPSLGRDEFEKLLVGDPDDWDVNGPLEWESYVERLSSSYEVDILDIDIKHSLRDNEEDPCLTRENAEYLNNQPFSRKYYLCREIALCMTDDPDFREAQRVIVNEVVSRYRKYEQSGKEA